MFFCCSVYRPVEMKRILGVGAGSLSKKKVAQVN